MGSTRVLQLVIQDEYHPEKALEGYSGLKNWFPLLIGTYCIYEPKSGSTTITKSNVFLGFFI